MNTFWSYLSSISKGDKETLNLPANNLDHLLAKFFKDARKINGDEYKPDTLSGFQQSIQRFLSHGKSPLNILVQEEFQTSRKVLAAEQKSLVQKAGKGNRPNATHTDEDEDKLFQSGIWCFQSKSPAKSHVVVFIPPFRLYSQRGKPRVALGRRGTAATSCPRRPRKACLGKWTWDKVARKWPPASVPAKDLRNKHCKVSHKILQAFPGSLTQGNEATRFTILFLLSDTAVVMKKAKYGTWNHH